jgi:hypothetical protein
MFACFLPLSFASELPDCGLNGSFPIACYNLTTLRKLCLPPLLSSPSFLSNLDTNPIQGPFLPAISRLSLLTSMCGTAPFLVSST